MLAPGAPPEGLPVVELTRGGVFLRAESRLPAVRTVVKLVLSHPSLRGDVEVEGEVVRHVTPAEAEAWHTAPGFGVQFQGAAPEARAAIGALADEVRRDTPRPAPPPSREG
ncbi:MAG TPA: PilZ domain-containing protein, partial [Anaeromyxobacter sp.]